MQKLKKNFVLMLASLLVIIMTSCASKPKLKPVLPPKPERPVLNPPNSDDDLEWEKYYNKTIDELQYTITLWEYWGEFAESVIE